MAYAKPNKTQSPVRTTPRRGKSVRVSARPTNPLADFAEAAGTTNFGVRVWLAWDAPSSTSPNWVDITPWVEQDMPINISHGRADGIADVNATTCSLAVDNSDGRFCAVNTAGPWYGLIHKGVWLKVEIVPPSGTVVQRFTGFVTNLPTAWQGQYAISRITASDRFEKLGQAPSLISCIQSEVLTDPNLTGNVKAYWNLHEATGSLTFGDTSGNGGTHMTAVGLGGGAGIGFGASNVSGPGFDGLRCPTFNPVSTTQGTYLFAPVSMPAQGSYAGTVYTGLYGTLEFWFQATTTGVRQFLAGINDTSAQCGFNIFLETTGYLNVALTRTAVGNPMNYSLSNYIFLGGRLDDGRWHSVAFGIASGQSVNNINTCMTVDGHLLAPGSLAVTGAPPGTNYSQVTLGAGYDHLNPGVLTLGASNLAEASWYWSDYFNPVGSAGRPPDVVTHYNAGATGFLGESTDNRVARVARYAGVPIPLSVVSDGLGWGQVQRYNPTKGPWTNLSPGAHACGTQSASGRKALDVMREAARTEGIPLFVDRSGYLTLQASTIRQNTSPVWTVDARDIAPDTALADDFAYTVNQMTVTPNGQAAQTVIGTVGTASQAKYGVYDKSQATASLNPVEARSLGLSYIQLGADPPPRLAPLVVEVATLATQAGYGAAWYDAVLATEVSTPIRVTNLPAQAGGGSYDVLVEGWSETITAGNHLFSFTTSPVQGPTYQLDDAVLGRVDTDGSTLTTGIGTADTTMTVATTGQATGSPLWVTDGLQFPFDVKVDGEQMTVTSISSLFGNGATIADGTFESGVANWTPSASCTVTSTSADKYAGTKSALLASTAFVAIQLFCPNTAVTAASTYLLNMWVKFASGSVPSAYVNLIWFNSSFTQIGTSNGTITTLGAGWTNITGTFTAPAGAAWAQFGPTSNSASSGSSFYVDNIVFQLTTGPQQFVMTRSVNGVVASHSAGAAVSLWSPTTLAY